MRNVWEEAGDNGNGGTQTYMEFLEVYLFKNDRLHAIEKKLFRFIKSMYLNKYT
jgi:hypothetical protein